MRRLAGIIIANLVMATAGFGGWLAWAHGTLSGVEALLAVACVLIGSGQLAALIGRDRGHAALARRAARLGEVNERLGDEAMRLRERIEALEHAFRAAEEAARAQAQAQFEALEALAGEIADLRANPVAQHGPGAAFRAPAGDPAAPGAATSEQETAPAIAIETVRRAVRDGRVELCLQPIVTLPQRRTRHYEAIARLRDDDGRPVLAGAFAPVAARAGLMPAIDAIALRRAADVARRLSGRDRPPAVFCDLSAQSLVDSELFPQLLEFLAANRALAASLVPEFAQAEIDAAGPLELESLALLRELGFRFSLDRVRHLDIDAGRLAGLGFRHLKVPARTLIDGMEEAGAQIHAADLGTHLARHAIELVADGVGDERTAVDLLDFDVGLGQGALFGSPRPVRGDLAAEPEHRRAA